MQAPTETQLQSLTLEEARERDGSSNFLPTKVLPGQKLFVMTYGIPNEPAEDGTIAVIRLFGCYPNDKEAEERATAELRKVDCKVVRIEPTGNWIRLRNPKLARRDQYEHFSNGQVKKFVTKMNADMDKKEKEDEREMREEMQKVMKDSQQEEDKESVEHFMLLREKIRALPGLIGNHQEKIAYHTREILRLQTLTPNYIVEHDALLAKYPDYNKRADDLIKTYRQP